MALQHNIIFQATVARGWKTYFLLNYVSNPSVNRIPYYIDRKNVAMI